MNTVIEPDCFDLNDWVLLNYPAIHEASKYLNPSAQYAFHLSVWREKGFPVIESEAASPMNPPAHIHVSCPSGGEIHVGPFDSLADASCYMANYPAEIRKVCTVSDSHPVVGTVFAPDAEWVQEAIS